MKPLQEWLKANKFTAHSLIFLAMIFASGLLFISAGAGSLAFTWVLLGIFAIANLFALFV